MEPKKRRGRKPGPNSAKEYFGDREELAVKIYLALGRDHRLSEVLHKMFSENSSTITHVLLDLVDCLRKQEVKVRVKAAAVADAKQKQVKFEQQKWEDNYGWAIPIAYTSIDDLQDEDVFRVLGIENETDLFYSDDQCAKWAEDLEGQMIRMKNIRDEVFRDVMNPALLKLVQGVRQMPMFQKIIGISSEQLEEDAYYHLVFQLDKFKVDQINSQGKRVKAYSYYGTVVKNYILGIKINLDKQVNEQGGTPLDVDEVPLLADDSSAVEEFEDLRNTIVGEIDNVMATRRMNRNDIAVGNSLKYMLINWHSIEFQTKNEFVRLLCQYAQLDSPVVGRSLKKFKTAVYDKFLAKNAFAKGKREKKNTGDK